MISVPGKSTQYALRPRGEDKKVIPKASRQKEKFNFLYAQVSPTRSLMAASAKTKEKYKMKPKTQEEEEQNGKRSAYFEAKLTEKID
eukprot:SAG11_NODE_6335_length_1334_cov_1.237247_2_plen_86_part_01